MEKKRMDTVYGMLGKNELLFMVREKSLPGTLVLESLAPFPGYYDQQDHDLRPVYLYLVLDREYSVFDIERAQNAIKKIYNWRFEAAKGKIDLHDKHLEVVRLRHLDSFDQLIPIQTAFEKQGIHQKMNAAMYERKDSGFIQLFKLFNILKLSKGIYTDATEDFHAYLVMPRQLNREEFEEATLKVKYNWDLPGFDAAYGCFLIKGKLKEMVRVYSKNLTVEYLSELRQLYLLKI